MIEDVFLLTCLSTVTEDDTSSCVFLHSQMKLSSECNLSTINAIITPSYCLGTQYAAQCLISPPETKSVVAGI